jgi:hypothetical protein
VRDAALLGLTRRAPLAGCRQRGGQRRQREDARHRVGGPPRHRVREQPDDRVPDDPGDRLRADHEAHRPCGVALVEPRADAREPGRQQERHAQADDGVPGVEDDERRRGRRDGEAREHQQGAADDRGAHADAIDRAADAQRRQGRRPREQRPGLAHRAHGAVEVLPDRDDDRREHHDARLRRGGRQDERD